MLYSTIKIKKKIVSKEYNTTQQFQFETYKWHCGIKYIFIVVTCVLLATALVTCSIKLQCVGGMLSLYKILHKTTANVTSFGEQKIKKILGKLRA